MSERALRQVQEGRGEVVEQKLSADWAYPYVANLVKSQYSTVRSDADSEQAVEHRRPQRRPRLLHPWVAADMLRDLVDAHQAKAAMTPGLAEAVEVVIEWLDFLEPDSRHAGYSTNGDPFGAERKTRPGSGEIGVPKEEWPPAWTDCGAGDPALCRLHPGPCNACREIGEGGRP